MYASQRPIEFLNHSIERLNKCRPPSDQHIIVSRPHSNWREPSHNFTQTTAHPITFDRGADFL
jgi:hypothetical protein